MSSKCQNRFYQTTGWLVMPISQYLHILSNNFSKGLHLGHSYINWIPTPMFDIHLLWTVQTIPYHLKTPIKQIEKKYAPYQHGATFRFQYLNYAHIKIHVLWTVKKKVPTFQCKIERRPHPLQRSTIQNINFFM